MNQLKIPFLIACGLLILTPLSAQDWEEISSGRLITLIEGTQRVKTYFNPNKVTQGPGKRDLMYTYFDRQEIHMTQGGFTGYLLDGTYETFTLDHQLLSQGHFEKGLRTGKWLYWYPNGKLAKVEHWKNGRQHGITEQFDASGALQLRQSYKNGQLHGKTVVFSGGQQQSTVKYRKGILKDKPDKKDRAAKKEAKKQQRKKKKEKKEREKKSTEKESSEPLTPQKSNES